MLEQIEKMKQTISYQSVLLATACGLAAALLLLVDYLTRPIIAERVQEDQKAMIAEVLSGASYDNDIIGSRRTVTYEAKVMIFSMPKIPKVKSVTLLYKPMKKGIAERLNCLSALMMRGLFRGFGF